MIEERASVFRIDASRHRSGLRLLLLGAHPDDIEIGCGATVLRLVQEGLVSEAHWVVFSGDGVRIDEAHAGADAFLDGVDERRVLVRSFRDGFFQFDGAAIKEVFEDLKTSARPDLVLTHRTADLHQDHRFIGDLTWQTFRECPIWEYEIPKYDGDLRTPNLYVRVPDPLARRKVELLLDIYRSQADRPWFTAATFMAMLRLRGVESRAGSGYAEGFESRKTIV